MAVARAVFTANAALERCNISVLVRFGERRSVSGGTSEAQFGMEQR